MTFRELKYIIKSDIRRHHNSNSIYMWGVNASFRITYLFRITSYLKSKQNPFARIVLFILSILYKHQQWLTGIQLPIGTKIGKGLIFAHFSDIVIGSDVIIGDYCTIFQGVTIGSMRGFGGGRPKLGNNVIVFPGAKIIGNIKCGNNVVIGANAVVTKDVPDGAVVAGIPAKIISHKGSEINQHYRII